jgi:hypothetical protein
MKIDVRLEGETVWMTQAHMAELFQTTPQNITLHLQAIYEEGELTETATCKDYLQVRTEGARQVQRTLRHYNLDAIISVGYRVKSAVATRFRIWATQPESIKINLCQITSPFHCSCRFPAPKARLHTSLGQRPRTMSAPWNQGQRPGSILKFRSPIETGLQPSSDCMTPNMGRCPMLEWHRALGAGKRAFASSSVIRHRAMLSCAKTISHEMAGELAEAEYEKFHHKQIAQADQAGSDFDKAIKQLPPPPKRKRGGEK